MMTSKITKKDITNLAFNQGSLGMEFSWNYERQMHIAFAMMMNHNLKKIYEGDAEGYRDALVRHVEFFNVTPQLAPFIGGVVTSMEEMKARGEVDGEAIASIKTALMGPLSGIGDSIFVGCLRVIAVGIGISLAQAGNIMGPILYFVIAFGVEMVLRYALMYWSYNLGLTAVKMMTANAKAFTHAASVLGVFVVGALISNYGGGTKLGISIANGEGDPIVIQNYLNMILPCLIAFAFTMMCYTLIKKKNWTPVKCIALFLVIGIVGAAFGIWAGGYTPLVPVPWSVVA